MAEPRYLTSDQIEHFRAHGYLAPVPALSAAEAGAARRSLDALMVRTNNLSGSAARHKPHLYAKWVADLVRHPRILDAVEDLLGPDLLVWRSVFFVKPPHDVSYVAWHQDSAYWGLSTDDVVTAWVALTESSVANGCLRVVPGSHRSPEVPHTIRPGRHNQLLRGQAAMAVPEEHARAVELQPGEMSLHHVRMLHASGANGSAQPRVGLAIRYIATRVAQRGPRQGATLVRGVDRFGHFDHEPEPRYDEDPVALKWHRRSLRRYTAEVLWEALQRPSPASLLMVARLLAHPARLRSLAQAVWRGTPGR